MRLSLFGRRPVPSPTIPAAEAAPVQQSTPAHVSAPDTTVAAVLPSPALVRAAPPAAPVAAPIATPRIIGRRQNKGISLPEAPLVDEDTAGPVFETVNGTQVRYQAMSQVNPTGAVVPATMAAATYGALQSLVERVGNIDEWLCRRLQWSLGELGQYLTSEQADGVALAIDAADRGEGLIVGDMTGFGKGRIVAAVARSRILDGNQVVFMTEKANLFSDFWRDIRDIGSDKLFGRPVMLNDGAKIVDTASPDGAVLVPAWKKTELDRIMRAGELPTGSNMLMATYSQFNRSGTRKTDFLTEIARGAHVVLDESHNFVGDSTTSKTVGAAIETAGSTTFSSATYARDVTNLAVYSSVFPWLSELPGIEDMTPGQRRALAEESVRLATGAGRIIRREHDLTNMTLRMHGTEGEKLAQNEKLADSLAPILSRMAKLARRVDAILGERNESNQQHLETLGSATERKAERETWLTANFGTRLSALLGQFLVALNVDPCVDLCVETLLRGQRPVVVIENTMEALMRELSRDDARPAGTPENEDSVEAAEAGLEDAPPRDVEPEAEANGEAVASTPVFRPPTFRDALALVADRLIKVGVRKGVEWKREEVTLAEPGLKEAQAEILELVRDFPDLSLSPIDDIRERIEAEGRRLHAEGRIEKPWLTDEISARGMRVVNGAYVSMPGQDRNRTVSRFVNGAVHMLALTQAASTGLSIHDSDRFADHAQRHMIELSPPRNVLARIQMWGRVWRRGQLTEPLFSVLDTGLPFHSYDLAARNRKLRELSASVTGTNKATVSLDLPDPMDAVGNDAAHDLLQDHQALAVAMGITLDVDRETADPELYFVGKLFRRLPLLPIDQQAKVCSAFFASYEDRRRAGADPGSGRDLDGVWQPVRREILEAGDGSANPVSGRDVTVTTIRAQRLAQPMSAATTRAHIEDAAQRLGNAPFTGHLGALRQMRDAVLKAALPQKRFKTVRAALASADDNPVRRASDKLDRMEALLQGLYPGAVGKLPGEDGDMVDGVVLDIRPPPPERATLGREYEVIFASPGDERPRHVSLDVLVREPRVRLETNGDTARQLGVFDQSLGSATLVERKILDGNGIGAVLAATRLGCGTRVGYHDASGQARTGILLPRGVERRLAGTKGRTSLPEVAAHLLSQGATLQTDIVRPGEGVELRPDAKRGGVVMSIPSGKRAAKPFETAAMLALTGPFEGDWRGREAHVRRERVPAVLALLSAMGQGYHFDADHRATALELTRQLAPAPARTETTHSLVRPR